jgi:hypothetical protein
MNGRRGMAVEMTEFELVLPVLRENRINFLLGYDVNLRAGCRKMPYPAMEYTILGDLPERRQRNQAAGRRTAAPPVGTIRLYVIDQGQRSKAVLTDGHVRTYLPDHLDLVGRFQRRAKTVFLVQQLGYESTIADF